MNTVYFKQYGAERTGTNYTKHLIHENFKNARLFVNVFGSKHALPVKSYDEWLVEKTTTSRNMIEKLTDKKESLASINTETLIPLINIKDPYAYVASNKAMWHSNKMWSDMNDLLIRWCETYNTRYHEWVSLADNRCGVIIRYESMIEDLGSVLEEIQDCYGLEKRHDVFVDQQNNVRPSSELGVSINAAEFDPSKYTEKKYMQQLEDGVIDVITRKIDWEFFSRFGYYPET